MHLPDLDLIIFDPSDGYVFALVSIKLTLRERIAQTGYWKLKLSACSCHRHIKVYFITPDEDGTMTVKKPAEKGQSNSGNGY